MSIKFVRRIPIILILFTVMVFVCACKDFKQTNVTSKENSPDWVVNLAKEKNASQLFIVAGVDKSTACISMHEINSDGTWKEIMSTPGFIGKKGLGKAREGVAITPIGTFHFNRAFGIADDPGCSIKYKKVTEGDYWSGDYREGYAYNQMVSIKDYKDLDVSNSEHLIDYNKQYQYCLNISWNEDGIPGDGATFF